MPHPRCTRLAEVMLCNRESLSHAVNCYGTDQVARSHAVDGDFSGSAKVAQMSCHSNARSFMMNKQLPNACFLTIMHCNS